MSYRVEIYDQFKDIYSDSQNEGKLCFVKTQTFEGVDLERYTKIHNGVGSTVVIANDLDKEEAIDLVTELYISSQSEGSNYDDKKINLNEGGAELVITYPDGRVCNRVISIYKN